MIYVCRPIGVNTISMKITHKCKRKIALVQLSTCAKYKTVKNLSAQMQKRNKTLKKCTSAKLQNCTSTKVLNAKMALSAHFQIAVVHKCTT